MRTHARNTAVAFLCACLLLFQAPLCGLFAQASSSRAWASVPAAGVSEEYDAFTQVRLVVAELQLFCTEDFAASVGDIATRKNEAGEPLYDLKAVPQGGYGSFSYQWSRSVDGGDTVDIPGANVSIYALSGVAKLNLAGAAQPYELLEEGRVYEYTCTVTDGWGRTASASVSVTVPAGFAFGGAAGGMAQTGDDRGVAVLVLALTALSAALACSRLRRV